MFAFLKRLTFGTSGDIFLQVSAPSDYMLIVNIISKVIATWTAITSAAQCLLIKSLLEADLYVKWKALIHQGDIFNQSYSIRWKQRLDEQDTSLEAEDDGEEHLDAVFHTAKLGKTHQLHF